ncbi:MAG: hypothetical protein ACLQG3_04935 [Terracidiphilus sp.]
MGIRVNLEASLRILLHDTRLLRSALEAQVVRLERIELDLVTLQRALFSASGHKPPAPGVGQEVAYNLRVDPRPNGSSAFSIDGGAEFTLPPRLAEVFQFIASGEKDSAGDDPLVGWRNRPDIKAFLEQRTGKSVSAGYVNSLVNLLRNSLGGAGYERGLIQTHGRLGVRLALKRSAQGLTAPATARWRPDADPE